MSDPVKAASVLPDELWVKIMSYVAPEHDLELPLESLAQDQRNLLRMRSVCSTLNKLFLEFPKLSSCLILESPVCTPSLLAWLRCHSCCVETVMIEYLNEYAMEMVLGALMTQPQQLKSLTLGPCQESDLRMAACFSSLATLGLSADDPSDDFDISALQALPHLNTLSLCNGEYYTSELPEGLLTLLLDHANLELGEPATCVVPLQKLRVVFSHFSRDHKDGILAYTTLQELHLYNGSIAGSYTSDDNIVEFGRCNDGSFRCPHLSPMKCLRMLYVNLSAVRYDEPIDWGCLYCLSSLQVLTIHSTTHRLMINQNLTLLGNLSCLKLTGLASPSKSLVSVAVNVNWSAMPLLQSIFIVSDRLQFGPNMLELLQLSGLRHVTFLDSKRATAEPPSYFAPLVQGLITQRPEVILIVNGNRKLATAV